MDCRFRTLLGVVFALIIMASFAPTIDLMKVNAEEEPRYGGTLRIAIGASYVLPKWSPYQPGGAYWMYQYYTRPCWERLLRKNQNWEWIPELATDYSTPDGGLTWVFHLVRNATWHDGVPFTSADVKFHFETTANWTGKMRVLVLESTNIQTYVRSITTPDNYTVEFNMKKPTSIDDWYEGEHSFVMCMPKHIFEGVDLGGNSSALYTPIGTGPYKFVKYVKDVYIEFERNENYWRGPPYAETVIEKLYPDARAAVIALEAGDVDFIQDQMETLPVDFLRLTEDPNSGVTGVHYTNPTIIKLSMNLHPDNLARRPALQNTAVRRALSYAIDRKSICESVFFGMNTPNNQFYGLDFAAIRPSDVKDHPYDPAQAKQMLDNAGWTVKGDGWRFDLGDMVSYPQYIDAAEVVKKNWADIGVKINIKTMEFTSIVNKLQTGEKGIETEPGVSVLLQTEGAVYPSSAVKRQLYSTSIPGMGGGLNDVFYNSSAMDALIDELSVTVNQSDRNEIFKDIERLFDQDLPYIPLTERYKILLWGKGTENVAKACLPRASWINFHEIWFAAEESTTPSAEVPLIYTAGLIAMAIVIAVLVVYIAVRRRGKR